MCTRITNAASVAGEVLFQLQPLWTLETLAMAEHDLTSRIAPHLDRHLVFPLLEFLQERQLYADEEILKAKINLLSQTNMVDYAMDIHKSLYHTEEVPQGTFFICLWSWIFCLCEFKP